MATSPNVGKPVAVHISDDKIEYLLFENLNRAVHVSAAIDLTKQGRTVGIRVNRTAKGTEYVQDIPDESTEDNLKELHALTEAQLEKARNTPVYWIPRDSRQYPDWVINATEDGRRLLVDDLVELFFENLSKAVQEQSSKDEYLKHLYLLRDLFATPNFGPMFRRKLNSHQQLVDFFSYSPE